MFFTAMCLEPLAGVVTEHQFKGQCYAVYRQRARLQSFFGLLIYVAYVTDVVKQVVLISQQRCVKWIKNIIVVVI